MLKKLKFCIAAIFAVCLLSAGNVAFAAPICPVPTEVTQPDGTVITVTAYGDEFFSWREDENGNVIAYDEETGSYKYAKIENGNLVPTSETVGKPSLLRRTTTRLQREDVLSLWENAERVDYTQPDENNTQCAATFSNAVSQSDPPKKLLTFLIEFSDVKLKYDGEFWAKRMYSTNPKDISVVNYWKENANGADVFEPADTSSILDGMTGTVSRGSFVDVGYTITKCPEGVVKISLDMPHPIKTWDDKSSNLVGDIEHMVIAAIDTCFDWADETPYPIFIFAGYNESGGTGIGEIYPYATIGLETPDGFWTNRCVTQGELGANDVPAGIGITCHELGHSAFYLPDLYFSILPNAGWINNGLMYCSLMSTGCWGSLYNLSDDVPNEGNIWGDPYAHYMDQVPTHLDPWCKMQCGFVTPTIVDEWDGDINSISENGTDSQYNVLLVRSKAAANQYFLIENRQFVGYDNGLQIWNDARSWGNPFEGGIIIYHVDESAHETFNNNSIYHHFIMAEHTIDLEDDFIWEFVNTEGRNKLDGESSPNSNLHELKTYDNLSCSRWKDCHPQTLKSGISIEVLGNNGPSVRVTANVDEEYRLTMIEGARFTDLFPDANFCRAVLDMMEAKDGIARAPEDVLTAKDWIMLASLTHMDISEQGIKDLTGIEYFPILDRLACGGNEITHIDLSKNPNISFLNCSNNGLTELDTLHWERIAYLRCENNRLTDLDVSRLEHLTLLYCNNNLLTELNIGENKELAQLICDNNFLTQLNTANNPELSKLYCNNNRLTKLDISGNPVLNDLECSDNLLTSLNTSHNPELEFLECANNKLTELDLTNNPYIEGLWCFGNFMDKETPGNSIVGLELLEYLGEPESNEVLSFDKFIYYPQNDAEHEHTWDSGEITTKPTCAAAGVRTYTCTTCQATKTEEIAATGQHTPGTNWETDGTGHWHTCTACGSELDKAAHTKTWVMDQTQHWAKCNICGWVDTAKTAHVYDDDLDAVCDTCGYERVITPPVPPKPVSPSAPAPGPSIEPDPPEPPTPSHVSCSKDENCPLCRFTDTSATAWYHDGVHYSVENGLMSGYGGSKFGPNDTLTRGMLAQILYNETGRSAVSGGSPFDDVASGAWYADSVIWAVENGIVAGYGNGRFGPDDPITREQLAVMLWRYAGSPAASGTLDSFADQGKASGYALDALCWAVENGVMSGKGNGILDPAGQATRAEVAVMLYNYLTLEG